MSEAAERWGEGGGNRKDARKGGGEAEAAATSVCERERESQRENGRQLHPPKLRGEDRQRARPSNRQR